MLQISPKQNEIKERILAGDEQIWLIGALGTSKTFGSALMLLSLAYEYPKSIFGVGRKNTPEIRRGTLLSFEEVADKMNLSISINSQQLFLDLENGSRIMFFELDGSKDRQYAKIKSMNLTGAMVDEVDSVNREAWNTLYGRIGRHNETGCPAFIINTCNPNDAWVKEDIYDNWKKNNLPERTSVIEFETHDSFLGDEYYDKFKTMPEQWKKRYLENNWNYSDDTNSLFKYRFLDSSHTETINDGTKYVAFDVARYGTDRSVIAMWQGTTLIDIKIIKDKNQQRDIVEQSKELIQYCKDNGVGYEHTYADAVGLGAGVVDYCKEQQFYVREFVAGGRSDENYNNIRSESYVTLARAFEQGEAKIYANTPHLALLKKELTAHEYETKDKVMQLESKDKIKERLGMSPDISDAVAMAWWAISRPKQVYSAWTI